ncbi:hypothetical protein EUGRSUZ_E00558 [Eucalyptus grandis]|uniref:Uncharacterized protein n=2 Tax=Eucalyptus grandis TaxID=71139 RepID=A0ACC3KT29_EUCGR|nr:hypothetical protein EUGRSUZ_E00558 [Eucalyptus grandis]
MSMKSRFMYWFRANSASVFGVFRRPGTGGARQSHPSCSSPSRPIEAAVGAGPDPRSRRAGRDIEGPRLAAAGLPPAAWDGGCPHEQGLLCKLGASAHYLRLPYNVRGDRKGLLASDIPIGKLGNDMAH